jgi:hypothetical protein
MTYYFVMQDYEHPGKWKLIRSEMQPVMVTISTYETREEAEAALKIVAPPPAPSVLSTEIKY